MKNFVKIALVFAIIVSNFAVAQAQDQNFKIQPTAEGESSLRTTQENYIKDLGPVHVYQTEEGVILKSAKATGLAAEGFVGATMMTNGFFTPQGGFSIRYDAKNVTGRLSVSVLSREYNEEAVKSGKRYMSYAADAAFHYNFFKGGYYENIWSVYANVGYIFGKHSYQVGEAEVEEGTIVTSVRHNGSGITFGGGVEYRHNFFATGNSLTVRAGYKSLPNTFVNNTKINGCFEVSVGFCFGISRSRAK